MTSSHIISGLPVLSGRGGAGLRKTVEELGRGSRWALLEPLPTTRELAERFGVSNATTHRTLSALEREGVLWRSPNGRFYFPAAKRLLAKPKPIACLLRRMENWTEVSQQIMQGADAACGNNDTGLLLIHDKILHHQTAAESTPQVATLRQQKKTLEDFIAIHRSGIGGVLLDELWADKALEPLIENLGPAVVLYRYTSLASLGNVAADFAAGALLAISHLFARGYEEIIIVRPFSNYAPVDQMIAACENSMDALQARSRREIYELKAVNRNAGLIKRLAHRQKKTALICPEDNFALFLLRELQRAGLHVPEKVGLLSCMGTVIARNAGITSLVYDFSEMGASAVSMLSRQKMERKMIQPSFFFGETT